MVKSKTPLTEPSPEQVEEHTRLRSQLYKEQVTQRISKWFENNFDSQFSRNSNCNQLNPLIHILFGKGEGNQIIM